MANSASDSGASNRPEKVFRIGYVSASVFTHEVRNGDDIRLIRSVNVQKRYADGDSVKYTSSFGLAELPQALRVLQLATAWVEQAEAEIAMPG
ncbi:MAG: hypothetical protein KDA91_18610 [Planctomycetaceae bacterium]|nr:hypothetical protein [Planctomycetaceae bacterium]